VSAAWHDCIRHALTDPAATFPNPRGIRIPQPTAYWGLQDWLGIHGRCQASQGAMVLHPIAYHQPWLRLRGRPSMGLSDVPYSQKSRERGGISAEKVRRGELGELDHFPCWYCVKYLDKVPVLKDIPRHPWAQL
jgi:hypothetical protein